MKRYASLFCAACLVALVMAACVPGVKGGDTGSVTFAFGNEGAKSIVPGISMDVVSYVVTGVGPGGAVFSQTMTGTTTVGQMLPGSWHFDVHGLNATSDDIGAGAVDVFVTVGQSAAAHVTVAEYTAATGSLHVGLSWEPNIVTHPEWTGLLSRNSVDQALAFTIDAPNTTATTDKDNLAPGWSALVVRLYDAPTGLDGSEVFSTGAATAVRIASGQLSSGTIAVHAIQQHGTIAFDFALDFNDALTLTPSVPFGSLTLHSGNTQDFSISANKASLFGWYLDGQQVHVGATYSLPADSLLDGENYRLDVLGFSLDGKSGGSGTYIVQRTSMPDEAYGITATFQQTADGVMHGAVVNMDGTIAQQFDSTQQAAGYSVAHTFPLLSVGSYKLKVWYTVGTTTWYGGTDLESATTVVIPTMPAIDVGTLYAW